MGALDNSNLVTGLCQGCDCSGFIPSFNWSLDSGVLTIEDDDSAFDVGDSLKNANIIVVSNVTDERAVGQIATGETSVDIDVSGLNLSEGYFIKVMALSAMGCVSDGHVKVLVPGDNSGTIAYWDKESRTNVSITASEES